MMRKELFLYGVIGLISNFVLYLAYLLLNLSGLEPKQAMTAVYALGIIQSYLAHRLWTFHILDRSIQRFLRYTISYAM